MAHEPGRVLISSKSPEDASRGLDLARTALSCSRHVVCKPPVKQFDPAQNRRLQTTKPEIQHFTVLPRRASIGDWLGPCHERALRITPHLTTQQQHGNHAAPHRTTTSRIVHSKLILTFLVRSYLTGLVSARDSRASRLDVIVAENRRVCLEVGRASAIHLSSLWREAHKGGEGRQRTHSAGPPPGRSCRHKNGCGHGNAAKQKDLAPPPRVVHTPASFLASLRCCRRAAGID